MHFANFAFLHHQFSYARTHGLHDANRVPNAPRLLAFLGSTPSAEADILATMGQHTWEYYETAEWMGEMKRTGMHIHPTAGYGDPGLIKDFQANLMGVRFSHAISHNPIAWDDVRGILHAVDSPDSLLSY